MNKKLTNWLLALLALVCVGAFTACNNSGSDMKKLLSTVPAETPVMASVQLDPVLEQIEFKKDGDKYTYCKELKDALDLAGADSKIVKHVCALLASTKKNMVVFASPDDFDRLWITFNIENTDEFIDAVVRLAKDDNDNIEFDKDGEYMLAEDNVAIRGNQVWISSKKIDTDDIDEFVKLDKKSFAAVNGSLTDRICSDGVISSSCLNIEELCSAMRKMGGEAEASQLKMALSLIFDNACYVFSTSTLNNTTCESVTDVLNSEYEMAKYLLPASKIEPAALAKINNNAPFVSALAVPSALMEKITGLITTLSGGHMSAQDNMVINILNNINGTLAYSLTDLTDWTFSIPFKEASTATSAGTLFAQNSGLTTSVAGNYLVVRSKGDATSGGSAPDGFGNQMAAFRLDFSKIPESVISGVKLSQLGNITLTAGIHEQGVRITCKWECNHLIPTLLKTACNVAKDFATGNVQIPILEQLYGGSSTYDDYEYEEVVEEVEWYDSAVAEPEPDYLY